jgi:hypothetical protein
MGYVSVAYHSASFSSLVPDLHIEGALQAIHVMLDKSQLELIKGLVEMNLGETIDEFEKPSTVIRDPIGQVRGGGGVDFQ